MMMRRLQLGALRRVVLLMMLVAACPAQSSSVPTSPFASTAKIAKLAKPKPAIKKIRIGIEPQKHSVALVALGCPKNTVDAEVMLGDLQRNGLRVVKQPEDADIVIVNTCAFVEDAKAESIAAVVEAAALKEDGRVPARGLFVTGCLAQRYAEELATELPEVDAVVGFEHYADLPDQVMRVLEETAPAETDVEEAAEAATTVLVGSASVPFRNEEDRVRLTASHTAYIRVAEGCDHACSFCAIPGFRGSFRSKPYDVVMAEAERLVASGVREINLIAEDTNQYGSDWGESDPRRLPDLLRAIDALPRLQWIRLLYCYPSYFSEELVDAIATIPKVVKYIDIPLQHMSDPVLKAMRRPTYAVARRMLDRLRAKIPDLVLRTTFISGFPGETDEDHRELVRRASELGFARGGAFAYSQEEGTPAAEMEDEMLDEEVRWARRDEMVAGFQARGRAWAHAQVGRTLRVMVDKMEGLDAVGRTEYDAPDIDSTVRIPAMPLAPGSVVNVRIVAADEVDLIAEMAPVGVDATMKYSTKAAVVDCEAEPLLEECVADVVA